MRGVGSRETVGVGGHGLAYARAEDSVKNGAVRRVAGDALVEVEEVAGEVHTVVNVEAGRAKVLDGGAGGDEPFDAGLFQEQLNMRGHRGVHAAAVVVPPCLEEFAAGREGL